MAATVTPPREPTIASQAFASSGANGNGLLSRIWISGAQPGWTGFSVSAAVHLFAMAAAALIVFELPSGPDLPTVDGLWSEPDPPVAPLVDVAPSSEATLDPGGRTAKGVMTLIDAEAPVAANPERALRPVVSPREAPPEPWSDQELVADVGAAKAAIGQGRGTGDGVGDGKGFFGISGGVGRRIVYVVDNSNSMNHPHDSQAKTRFRRLKVELVNSIWHMSPEQEFYVIFFSNETYPMPATTLQRATPSAKQTYLEWVARMDSYGAPTDPRGAMALALKFEPDIIYFLTDGEFEQPVNRTLTRIKQHRVTIHTFAFGERMGEKVLETLAKNNQGKYKFVP